MQKCQSILPLVQSDPHIKSKIPRFTESNMWNALFPRYSAPKGSLTSKQISFKCLAQVKYLKWFFGPLCKRSKKKPGGLLYLLSFSSLLLGECVYQDVFHCAWLLRSQRPKSTVLTQINGLCWFQQFLAVREIYNRSSPVGLMNFARLAARSVLWLLNTGQSRHDTTEINCLFFFIFYFPTKELWLSASLTSS